MHSKRVITSLFSSILTLLLLVFAYRYFSALVDQIHSTDFIVNWMYVVASGALFLGFYGLLSLHWLYACRLVMQNVPRDQWLAFFASQPYKYLPTSLFTFSFRGVYAKKLGMSFRKSSLAQLLENLSLMVSSCFVATVFFSARVQPLLAVPACIVAAGVVWLVLQKGASGLKFRGREFNVPSIQLVRLVALSTVSWLLAGGAFILLTYALGLQINILGLVLANTLAFALGILAVFAPGGIGIRELVYDFFGVAAGAIVAWRILTFVLDCLVGLVSIIAIRYRKS